MGALDSVKRRPGCGFGPAAILAGGPAVRALAGVAAVAASAGGAALVALAGCAAPPGGPAVAPYLLAVSYNVELLEALGPSDNTSIMREDFGQIRKLGFDAVFVRHAEDAAVPAVGHAAQQAGLKAAASRRDELYYLRTGRLPAGCPSVAALVAGGRRGGQPALVVFDGVVDAGTAVRARELAAAHRAGRSPPTTLAIMAGQTGGLAGSGVSPASMRPEASLVACPADFRGGEADGSMMILPCVQRTDEQVPEAASRWLRQYHEGLAAGLTGGLIVDGFRVVPGQWRGLVEGSEPLAVDRATALLRITARAGYWGPLLRRLTPITVRPLGPVSDDLRVVLFRGAKRRFILLINSSDTRFLRGTVDLPGELDSQRVNRAVLVPADPNKIDGQVVEPRTQRLSLRADLRPGDAALWELFSGPIP